MRRSMTIRDRWLAAAWLVLLVPLGWHTYVGAFSRYLADDFCTAGSLRNSGFWGSQRHWYTTWSGRFSFTFSINLSQLAGPRLTPWLVGLALVAWLLACTWLLAALYRGLRTASPGAAALLTSAFLLVVILDDTPDLYQSVYWPTGLFTYSVPLVIFTAYLAWLAQRWSRGGAGPALGWQAGLSLLWMFVSGGFSETFVSFQIAALVLLLLAAALDRDKPRRREAVFLLLAGLAGSACAMAVILAAPGNVVRMGAMPPPADAVTILLRSMRDAEVFMIKALASAKWLMVLSGTIPLLLVVSSPGEADREASLAGNLRKLSLPIGLVPVLTYGLILAVMAPSEYATSNYPAWRALITAQYALVAGTAGGGMLVGLLLRPVAARWPADGRALAGLVGALVLALCISAAALALPPILSQLPDVRYYARTWDERDAKLRGAAASGEQQVRAASLNHMGDLAEIGYDPQEWVNRCVAQTYGLKEVIAK